MNERVCGFCKYHQVYYDEIDGDIYSDGCVCNHPDENNEHRDSCYEASSHIKECHLFEQE